MKRLVTLLPLLLVACGTPQEHCIAAGTRDLRTVDRLIGETAGNLKRGYALEKRVLRFRTFTPCRVPVPPAPDGTPQPPAVMMCPDTDERIVTEPKAIDLDAEARKLAQLQAKRKDLLRAAEKVTADCQAQFPE